jgi:coenzyme Q-binding protein COQ10
MDFVDAIELPYSCRELFEVVADVERYPMFLPHWHRVRILRCDGGRLLVEQLLLSGFVPIRFRSTALLEAPHRISIAVQEGPLRQLRIEWRFTATAERACRVEVRIGMEVASSLLRRSFKVLLGDSGNRLLGLFAERAQRVYRPPARP